MALPPRAGASAVQPRTRLDFTLDLVTRILVEAKLLTEGERRDVMNRESIQRARLNKTIAASKADRREVNPVELVASFELPLPGGRTGEKLDEDRIMDAVAKKLGFGYWKIDPLKLDMALITRLISRPFARKHVVLPYKMTEPAKQVLEVLVGNPFDIELFESLRQLAGDGDPAGAVGHQRHPALRRRDLRLQAAASPRRRRSRWARRARSTSGTSSSWSSSPASRSSRPPTSRSSARSSTCSTTPSASAPATSTSSRAASTGIVRMRIDGVLHQVYTIPKAVHAPIVARIKMLARMDIAEKRRPQDGRIKTSQARAKRRSSCASPACRWPSARSSSSASSRAACRTSPSSASRPTSSRRSTRWIRQPHGLVLVTGPTGSGKTTTLYGALKMISDDAINVTTIEDPVEMVLETCNQINVQPKIDLTFADALRHVLRQDPDVIMVGEIRDEETAQNAVQAALTGHLVLSTLHTNDAASAITRLRDLGVPSFLLSSTLAGAIAQRLLRMICARCVKPTTLAVDQIAALGLGRPEDLEGKLQVAYGEGCPRCRGTGYYGRTGIFELLSVTPKIRGMIAAGDNVGEIAKVAQLDGMRTLRENAVRKLAAGLTTFEEVYAATRDVEAVR